MIGESECDTYTFPNRALPERAVCRAHSAGSRRVRHVGEGVWDSPATPGIHLDK
jgi:hypothetical protein